ncbi:hypothetical protein ACFE04_002883 [Oxalis oulophora]
MADPYALPDLRQHSTGRTHFPDQPPQPFYLPINFIPPTPLHHHDGTIMVGTNDHHEFITSSSHHGFANSNYTYNVATAPGLMHMESTSINGWQKYSNNINNNEGLLLINHHHNNNMSSSSRWPRQETLTLLEIRSRLDSQFKEANQKGPLWDEVARIMAEEHGYHRNGKKCREKFENLYKYYKKTKEGKAEGKHYRFFRQLEALYSCETSNTTTNNNNFQEQTLISFSNSHQSPEFETSSSSANNHDHDLSAIAFVMNQEQKVVHLKKNNNLEEKIKELVDSRMRKIIETQEVFMEKMLKTIEDREQERISRDEQWRKQEIARLNQEHEFSSREVRANWFRSRDAMLMESLRKFAHAKESCSSININDYGSTRWTDPEISSLIQLKNGMESKFEDGNVSFWEEIGLKMASLGYERSGNECKEKWESMQLYFNMATECYKKNKEDLRTSNYYF